jgi:hypothetical protein
MPVADNKKLHAEIIVYGRTSSAGSGVIRTVNTFHYRRNAVVVPADKTALDTAFQAAVVVPMGAALNNRWTQDFNTVRFINDPLDPPTSFSHAVVGGRTGDSMASLNCAYVLMRTAFRGKSYRGFKRFGPLSESDTTAATEDILNAASIALFATLRTAMIATLVDATPNSWTLEVVSRLLSNFDVTPCIVESADVNQIVLNKRITRSKRRETASVY